MFCLYCFSSLPLALLALLFMPEEFFIMHFSDLIQETKERAREGKISQTVKEWVLKDDLMYDD